MEDWGAQPLVMTKLQSPRRGDDTSGNEPVTVTPSVGSVLMASPRHTASSNPAFSGGRQEPRSLAASQGESFCFSGLQLLITKMGRQFLNLSHRTE